MSVTSSTITIKTIDLATPLPATPPPTAARAALTSLTVEKLFKELSQAQHQHLSPISQGKIKQILENNSLSNDAKLKELIAIGSTILPPHDAWSTGEPDKPTRMLLANSLSELMPLEFANQFEEITKSFSIIRQEDICNIALAIAPQITDDPTWRKFLCSVAQCAPNIGYLIKGLKIQDEQLRIEIARIIIKQNPLVFLMMFEQFNISDEKALVEFAFLIAERHTSGLSDKLEKFKIHDKETLLKLARFLAETNPAELAENIQKYKIDDEAIRAQLAHAIIKSERALRTMDSVLALRIDNFNLNNALLVELAFTIAKTAPEAIPKNIDKFKIRDEATRINLAEIILEGAPHELIESFEKFVISQEAIRFMFAFILAEKVPNRLLRYIKKFNINDEKLVCLITSLLAKSAEILDEIFTTFNIQDETTKNTLALIAAHTHAASVCRLIETRQISIKDLNTVNYIFAECLRQSGIVPMLLLPKIPDSCNESYFKELDEAIRKKEDEGVKAHLRMWINFYKALCCNKQFTKEEVEARLPIALQIVNFGNPNLRYALTETLVNTDISNDILKAPSHTILIHLLVHHVKKFAGWNQVEVEQILSNVTKNISHDNVKKDIFIRCFYNLFHCTDITAPQKGNLVKHLFYPSATQKAEADVKIKIDITGTAGTYIAQKDSESEKGLAGLQFLDAIILAGKASMLTTRVWEIQEQTEKNISTINMLESLKKPLQLSKTFEQIFINIIGLTDVEGFDKKYSQTIGQTRNPNALLIYAGKILSTHRNDNVFIMHHLREFVEAIFQGNDQYRTWRYDITCSTHHMTKIFAPFDEHGKSLVNEALLKKWQEGKKAAFKNLEEADQKASKETMVTAQIVRNMNEFGIHLELADKELASVKICLKESKKCEDELKKLTQIVVGMKNEISRFEGLSAETAAKTKPELRNKLEAQSAKAEFQKLFIKILNSDQNKKIDAIETELVKLFEMTRKMYPGSEFENNMKDLLTYVKGYSRPKSFKHTKLVVEDTDNWIDLLLCGTEVAGSCQRIDGEAYYNKCLLGYLIDGKIRIVAVKDENQTIWGRCIMRLLWDDVLKKPVIFQERYYERLGAPSGIEKAINAMFKERAKDLGMPLVRAMDKADASKAYPNSLQSFNCPAPYEYVDAGKLNVTNGTYTIPAAAIQRVVS